MRYLFAICLAAANVCVAQTPVTTASAPRPTKADSAGVRRAMLDYLEGFYEGDTAKLVRSLRPDVFKYGFEKEKGAKAYVGERMTYDEAIAYARRFHDGKRTTPASAPRDVIVFEILDQTASAKVRAWWGSDYLLLGKYDGHWMISHVLWQGP